MLTRATPCPHCSYLKERNVGMNDLFKTGGQSLLEGKAGDDNTIKVRRPACARKIKKTNKQPLTTLDNAGTPHRSTASDELPC